MFNVGIADVGLDAGWQDCINGTYHNATTGHVMVDTAFPDLRAMTDHAHTLGLTASWYLNCDGCGAVRGAPTHYTPDSDDAVTKFNFDGVKFDSQRVSVACYHFLRTSSDTRGKTGRYSDSASRCPCLAGWA